MKIQTISDVHCEFHKDKGLRFARELPVEGDVLVLPGDFATSRELTSTLSELCLRFPHVVHVPGNHEYYGSSRDVINNKLSKLARSFDNFHPLNNNIVVIDGKRFLGTPLWWDATGVPPHVFGEIRRYLNDFSLIQGYSKWIGRENLESIDFLRNNIQKGDIVVTHHAPSWQSKPAYRRGKLSSMDHAYYNDLDQMIFEKQAKLWMHGHTHDHVDYVIGETRVVSFPHGYAIDERGRLTGTCWLDRHGVIEV